MEDANKKVLWEGYGMDYYGGMRTRTGMVCKTNLGLLELKKARDTVPHIRFAHDVKEQLYRNGFEHIARFRESLEGNPFFHWNETTYVLEDVLPRDVLEEDGLEAFAKGAKTLGQMHKNAHGLESAYGLWNSEKLPQQFAKRQGEFAKIKRRVQKMGKLDAIDMLVVQNYTPYMERVECALEYLDLGEYTIHMEGEKKRGTFCHRTFKGSNIRTQNNQIFVGGFDHATADLGLLDLAAYLKRYMKKLDGTKEGVCKIVETYNDIAHLTDKEFLLLQAFIIYPEKFLRLLNEFYNRRKTCISPAMEQRMMEVITEENKSQKLLGYLE